MGMRGMLKPPRTELTPAELRVGQLIGRGWTYKRAAEELGVTPKGIVKHVEAIAAKLPNPDNVMPGTLVMLEFARRRWLGLTDGDRAAALDLPNTVQALHVLAMRQCDHALAARKNGDRETYRSHMQAALVYETNATAMAVERRVSDATVTILVNSAARIARDLQTVG